jgi:mannose/fructose/N-acetylgalactosamine-specific phosphotransferase system component IIB
MPVLLCRVDDRLIHGQVVLGWGRPLGLERIVLVDDDVAANTWEQQLYRMAVPASIDVVFASIAGAIAGLVEWEADGVRTALLTGDIASMAALHAAHPGAVHRINLGGLHLTDAELTALRALERDGAQVTAQDVPTAQPVALESIA